MRRGGEREGSVGASFLVWRVMLAKFVKGRGGERGCQERTSSSSLSLSIIAASISGVVRFLPRPFVAAGVRGGLLGETAISL